MFTLLCNLALYRIKIFFYIFTQALLFSPPSSSKPFLKGTGFGSQDYDLYIDCFVSCFRITPHNNDVLKVCLNPSSPPMYHFVLVNALHRIITQVCVLFHLRMQFQIGQFHQMFILLPNQFYFRLILTFISSYLD